MIKNSTNFKLGLFILAGVVLLIAAMFAFGLKDIFVRKGKICSFFYESVQGLAVGSPVKFKGVPIGSVSKISIGVNDKLIRIDMDIELSAFSVRDDKNTTGIAQFYKFFEEERAMGLRCRLEYAGITGLKYVELDYFDTDNKMPVPVPEHVVQNNVSEGFVYIPSTPSTFQDMLSMISISLERMSKIDFVGISNEMKGSLNEARQLLADPNWKMILERAESIGANIEHSSTVLAETLTEERVKLFAEKLQDAVNNLNLLLKDLNEQTIAAQIPATTESFRDTAGNIRQTSTEIRNAAATITDNRRSLEVTLQKFNQTIDSLSELIDYLNRDPGALISGKKVRNPNEN